MSGTCDMHGRGERCVQGFWLGALKGRDNWEDLGISGRLT
jgi:hypothetical protein